jgi:hypothetical protein
MARSFLPPGALVLCLVWVAQTAVCAGAQALALSGTRDLLTTDAGAFVRWLQNARPAPVSSLEKTRILSSLPRQGEVTNLDARARHKLAALNQVLRAADRESVYVVKVIDVPQAAVGLHARTVLVISESALTLLSADELQALVAHEIGHEYLWLDYEGAIARADRGRLKELELLSDVIAIVTLHGVGLDGFRLMSGVEKISRFNQERFGVALNENDYPTLAERREFARATVAWTTAQQVPVGSR